MPSKTQPRSHEGFEDREEELVFVVCFVDLRVFVVAVF